MSENVDANE